MAALNDIYIFYDIETSFFTRQLDHISCFDPFETSPVFPDR